MIGTITIGNETRNLDDASESWIADQINRHRREGTVYVVITIKDSGVDVRLSTPSAPSGAVGGRAPSRREQEIFNLWNERGLNSTDFAAGNVIAFLKQVRRLL